MPSIIIQDLPPRNQYVASPTMQSVFIYNFPIFEPTDLLVFQYPAGGVPDDLTQQLTYLVDYTVAGMNLPNGGTITLVVPANVGDIITIVRAMSDERLNYYIDTAITADALNTDFESEVMMIQQNTMYNTQIAPHYNLDAQIIPFVDTYLPLLPPNNVWIKNSGNTAITTATLPSFPVGAVTGTTGTPMHIARWVSPLVLEDSLVTLDDGGNIYGATSVTAGSVMISGTTLTTTGGNLTITSNGGQLNIAAILNMTVDTPIRWYDAAGTNYVSFKAPSTLAVNTTWNLPPADGGAGFALVTDGAGNLSFAQIAAASSGSIAVPISQVGHGFTVGQVVVFNGTKYVLAQADNSVDAEVIGIVSSVIDSNDFILLTEGFISGLIGLTPGDVYFLSDVTPGLLSLTEPVTIGHISKPLFIAQTTTSGYFHNWRGKIIPAPNPALIAGQVSITVTQIAHGFTAGQVVLFNGTQYVLAQADNGIDAEVIGIVSMVVDANDFILTTEGFVTAFSGLTGGDVYFLSDATPGLLTLTEPSTVGHISKPLVIATGSTSGYFHNFRGKIIPNPGGGVDASAVSYEPGTPGNWSPVPTQVAEALDELAAGKQPLATNLTDVAALTPTANSFIYGNSAGTHFVNSVLQFGNVRYIDFNAGSDTTGDGSIYFPWQTLQHAYNSVTPNLNYPTIFNMVAGYDAADTGTVTGKPNVWLYGVGGQTQLPFNLTITGGSTSDQVIISDCIIYGTVTWVRNDATEIAMYLYNTELTGLADFEQQGSGVSSTLFFAYDCFLSGLTVRAGQATLDGTSCSGTFTYNDSGAGFLEVQGGNQFNAAWSLSGGMEAEFSGVYSDSGYTISTTTTGSGTPLIGTDSSSIPVSITGPGTFSLISQAKYVNSNYTPVHYTAVTQDVAGNLHGIDNALGAIVQGLTWVTVTSSQAMVAGHGYFVNSGSLVTLTLPATMAVGDTFQVVGMNTGGWTIAQNSGQQIRYSTHLTTSGAGGSVSSTSEGDAINLVCNVANTNLIATPGVIGTLTIV